MNEMVLYPELVDYIYYHCEQFQTPVEKLAVKTYIHDGPGITGRMREIYIRKGWISEEAEVKELLDKGFDKFKQDIAARIFEDHKNELDLNLCPQCFKIARTPKAKQCRFCYHDWH